MAYFEKKDYINANFYITKSADIRNTILPENNEQRITTKVLKEEITLHLI